MRLVGKSERFVGDKLLWVKEVAVVLPREAKSNLRIRLVGRRDGTGPEMVAGG